jgi:uncharacterized damage-inducible protein DinB
LPSLETILDNLGRAQRSLLRAADAVPAEQWNARPAEGRWSASELVAHLITVERSILAAADKALARPPKHVPLLKRFHVPMMLVESRLIRRKSPVAQDPGITGTKEDLLARLRDVRERTLAFIAETRSKDLSLYRWKHGFLGMLSLYEWFQMIASHEVRHTKQMREIAANLPKVVASSQK